MIGMEVNFSCQTSREEETESLGFLLGSFLRGGDCIALYGDLGAGKTAFSRGIAHGMGIATPVTSPSYLLCNEYDGITPLLHMDAYFFERLESLLAEGLAQRFPTSILVVEWAEKMGDWLPTDRLELHLEHLEGGGRQLHFSAPAQRARELLESLKEAQKARKPVNPPTDSPVDPSKSQ
ncbi:MAG TPA: tRNA (adenosine(37)-N6)-threonylcarbamoyltransferase complex ATPase subunit type 1 TsaE [Planctomycetota bacterium]|jgi:tRNA threonylcarbamoyladenosine biosynthesis protein TsaE|nr:tRNA (adenosine(37)-N6)-threonylcarbamoyltransferase complex ATPase subunit type 1 TsaE [Planctomycetota bacterium]HJM38533.1 tRNA (adenosine(37)-N6)-threonylcarbamoyltransferase complex ATPase subunit type 1 TsaE [Planctomycetota bacterium]